MSGRHNVLDCILREYQERAERGETPRAVFDLDSTIFCVSPRTKRILDLLTEDPELNARFPEFAPQLKGLEVRPSDWGIRTALERARVQGPMDFFHLVRDRWAAHFFSSDHLHADEPYPGAIEFVQHLAELGTEVRYLTGRDRPRMGTGTIEALKRWRLPLKEVEHLHMKPDSQRHDAEFKVDVLRKLHAAQSPIWFFENEPVVINLVRRHLPTLPVVFVDSVHSGREAAADDLPRIPMRYEFSRIK